MTGRCALWLLLLPACVGDVQIGSTTGFVEPADSILFGTAPVVLEADRPTEVISVVFRLDGEVFDEDVLRPFEGWLETEGMEEGEATLSATIHYDEPLTDPVVVERSVILDNLGPAVELVAPDTSRCVQPSGNIDFAADVTDDVGIRGVEIRINAVPIVVFEGPPYEYSTDGLGALVGSGDAELTVAAENARGLISSFSTSLDVCN